MKTIYSVEGMSCGKCAIKIQQGIASIQGVDAVSINPQSHCFFSNHL
mgnify:CR=1 FL=1